jgi:hypothetical protein
MTTQPATATATMTMTAAATAAIRGGGRSTSKGHMYIGRAVSPLARPYTHYILARSYVHAIIIRGAQKKQREMVNNEGNCKLAIPDSRHEGPGTLPMSGTISDNHLMERMGYI